MTIPKLSPDQQAKHDEVMQLAERYACAYGLVGHDVRKRRYDAFSTSIAQLCAQIGDAESMEAIAFFLEYPAEWDTAAYPNLESAIWETITCGKIQIDVLQSERNQLKAENERLKKLLGTRK